MYYHQISYKCLVLDYRFQMPIRRICRWKLMTKAGEARVDGDES
jgi:hypothetical protein